MTRRHESLWASTHDRSSLRTRRQIPYNLLYAHPSAYEQRITHVLRLIGVIVQWQQCAFVSNSMTFSLCYFRWITSVQIRAQEMFFLSFFLLSDLIPLCWLLTMYHIGQPRWGDNKSLWDKAIYIGPLLTLWGWETGVEGRLVNTAEIAAACGSQEKLETTVPMKEKTVLKKKKIECSEILIRMAHFYHILLYFQLDRRCLVAIDNLLFSCCFNEQVRLAGWWPCKEECVCLSSVAHFLKGRFISLKSYVSVAISIIVDQSGLKPWTSLKTAHDNVSCFLVHLVKCVSFHILINNMRDMMSRYF